MRRSFPWLLAWTALLVPPASARDKANDLLRVLTPAAKTPVSAHPFVNIVVGLGATFDGDGADPDTFHARLGRVDITPLFRRLTDARGNVIAMRAAAGPALIAVGRRANRLRFEVQSFPRGKAGRARDVDRVRFRAAETDNQAPIAHALADGEVILPGVPLRFDGTLSTDPDEDDLAYHWDFGDGSTSSEPRPTHVFPPQDIDATVSLTVSDGQTASAAGVTLFAVPPICPTCVLGLLRIEAPEALEFGAVTPGTPVTRTLTVRNPDVLPNSELNLRLGVDNPAFTLSPTDLSLHALESASIDVTFNPGAEGHQGTQLTVVASARNQPVTRILAHGYAGSAGGTGPLPVVAPAFFNTFGSGTQGILPSGARFDADNVVHTCVTPGNGPGTFDFCVADADCAANGGTCPTTGTCVRGDNNGLPCSRPSDCPGGLCPAAAFFDPEDMCGDGQGGLFISSGDGTYTDPNDSRDTLQSGSILHVQFDGAGNRTVSEIIARPTEGTTQIGCDGIPVDAGGRVYRAEYFNIEAPGDCFRDAREALIAVRKNGGGETVLMPRIDAAFGIPECEDFEPVTDLRVSRDGSSVFASGYYGIFRIRQTPLSMVSDWDDFFDLHPDDSVVLVTITNTGPTALLRVFKVSPDQARNGALLLNDLTPCVTVPLPNNRAPGGSHSLGLVNFAVERTAPGSFDATILVNFFSSGATQGAEAALSPGLGLRGTVAISSPAASNTCANLGLVNLELQDLLTF